MTDHYEAQNKQESDYADPLKKELMDRILKHYESDIVMVSTHPLKGKVMEFDYYNETAIYAPVNGNCSWSHDDMVDSMMIAAKYSIPPLTRWQRFKARVKAWWSK